MAWVKGGRYYQKSVRVNGKVTTLHYDGFLGRLVEMDDLGRREEAAEIRQEARQREAEQREAYRDEQARGRLIRDLVAVGCELAGFSRYSRGRWRKRRMQALPTQPLSPDDLAKVKAEIRQVLDDCKAGNPDALARLRKLGADHPDLVINATSADLFTLAVQALLKRCCGDPDPKKAAFEEVIKLRIRSLTAELAGENPSPIRRLCARAAAYADLEFWLAQMVATNSKPFSPALDRRLNSAHKRYLAALKTLAQISRLEQPRPRPVQAVQVNVTTPAAAGWPDGKAFDWLENLPAFPAPGK